MENFRKLLVWQKSKDLVKAVYDLTESFPKTEYYVMIPQIRRAAVSIPSNIAEGYGRRLKTEYIRFLRISSGSLYELETQLQIAYELGYLSEKDFGNLLTMTDEIGKLLSGFIKYLGRENS